MSVIILLIAPARGGLDVSRSSLLRPTDFGLVKSVFLNSSGRRGGKSGSASGSGSEPADLSAASVINRRSSLTGGISSSGKGRREKFGLLCGAFSMVLLTDRMREAILAEVYCLVRVC